MQPNIRSIRMRAKPGCDVIEVVRHRSLPSLSAVRSRA
jgi:hypothetical protein